MLESIFAKFKSRKEKTSNDVKAFKESGMKPEDMEQ